VLFSISDKPAQEALGIWREANSISGLRPDYGCAACGAAVRFPARLWM
jgi:hypothetical protein